MTLDDAAGRGLFLTVTSRYQDEVSPGVRRTMETIQRAVVSLGAAIAGLAIARHVKGWMKAFIDSGSELERMGRRTGLAVEELSALKYAAYQNDVEFGTMIRSLGILGKSLNAASREGSVQARIFRDLGVETRELSGKLRDPLEVFMEVGERLSVVDDNAKATAYSITLLGRSGQEMLPLLRNIGELESSMAEAKRLGLVTSAAQAAEAAAAENAVKSYEKAVDGLKRTIGGVMVSMVSPFTLMLRDALTKMKAILSESPNLTGALAAVGGSAGAIAALAGALAMAASGAVQFKVALAAMSLSLAQVATVALPVAAALAAVAFVYYQIQKERAAAEAALARNPWREEAEAIAETYRSAQALMGAYEELARKANRTREEEARLMEIRRRMNANPEFRWDVSGGKVDYGKYRDVVEKNRAEVRAQLAALERTIADNQIALATATGEARTVIVRSIRELQAAAEPLREALGLTRGSAEAGEDRLKQIRAEQEALAEIILAAQRERMSESEALEADYLARVRELGKLETVSEADKAIAKMEILLGYYARATEVVERWVAEIEAADAAIADSFRRVTEKRLAEAARGADQFAEAMLGKVRAEVAALEASQRATLERVRIQGEQEMLRVELDATLDEDSRAAMVAYIEYLTEIRQLQLEVEAAPTEEERSNLYDRMTTAALKYQRALQSLRREQGVLRTSTNVLTQAFLASFQAAILGQESFGAVMRRAVAEYIASQAALAAVGAIVEMAHGFAALATHRYQDAAFHFQAAAFYAAVAAVAGAAARGLAGGGGGGYGGGSGGEETGYQPREYSDEDLRRIRRGEAGGETGELEAEGRSAPVLVTFNVNAVDADGVGRFFRNNGRRLARSVADELYRNPAVAKRIGGVATRGL